MRIKRLTLHNFGVYAGTNSFDFTHKEPVVLIGGMNGRGKTTFLEAVLLSLYGSNSFSFKESSYNSYSKYLQSFVNESDGTFASYIELEFEIQNENKETYLIHREWDSKSKTTKEKIFVEKNAVYSDFLTNNWAMFIENLIPSALSSFYFFDGEKIAELAVDQTGSQMKDSIRAMLGITVLDTLKNDLIKNQKKYSKSAKGNETVEKLEKLKAVKESKEARVVKANETLDKLNIKYEALKEKNSFLKHQYEVKGGSVFEEKEQLIGKRAAVLSDIQSNKDNLVELAASELPLYLVKDLLQDIKLQAEDEHNELVMDQAIEQLDDYVEAFISLDKDNEKVSRQFLEFLKNQTKENRGDIVYDLSDHALFQVNDLLEIKLKNSHDETIKQLENKKLLNEQLDEFDSYLSLDINESELQNIFKKLKKNEMDIVECQAKIKIQEEKINELNVDLNRATLEYNKYLDAYLKNEEYIDDLDRKIRYTNLALEILGKYSVILQARKTGTLAETITDCYKQLANKKTLIKKIVMDPETLDIRYMSYTNEEVPKENLSAGEKQLMVISILWALAICSKKALPVIIDTPLSRMDSMHRTTIVSTYFPQASDQTIILSTDTEIDENYYALISDSVGDEFTLVYDEKTKSTSIQEGYFMEVKA